MQTWELVHVIDTTEEDDAPDPMAAPWLRFDEVEGWYVAGYKLAAIDREDAGHPRFIPLTRSVPYGIRSVATCAMACGGRIPNLACTCGFYAFDGELQRWPLVRLMNLRRRGPYRDFALLEVALSGRVAVFNGPYPGHVLRAEHQLIRSYRLLGDERHSEGRRSPLPGFGRSIEEGTLATGRRLPGSLPGGAPDDGRDGVGARPFHPVSPLSGGASVRVPTPDLPLGPAHGEPTRRDMTAAASSAS